MLNFRKKSRKMWRSLEKQNRGAKQWEHSIAFQGAKISHGGIQHAKMHSKVRNSKSKISHTSIQGAKHSPGTRVAFRTAQTNFRTMRIKVRKFRTPKSKVRNSFQSAKITVQGANSLNVSFAHHYSRCKNFAPCETPSWHTSGISHSSSQFSHRAKQGAKISHSAKLSAKLDSRCEILSLRCEKFAR